MRWGVSVRSMAICIALTMCGGPSASIAAAVAAADEQTFTTDTPQVTAAGHSFIAPAGWAMTRGDRMIVLGAPEQGSQVALIDAEATGADAAIADAWKTYRNGAKPELLMSLPIANHGGWQDGRHDVYRTPANAARVLSARAMRHGRHWAVRIDDLANAVNGKRAAELRLIREEFVPAGYVRERFAGRKAHALDAERVEALKRFVENAAKTLNVPGVSIGIVQDGKTLFAGGFGVRDIGKPARVDADTLYLIASNTKPLTTLMLAKLVDEGKFDWETPVTELLPQFRLADAQTTRQVRVKHLLCACTGLPYRNLDWEFAPANAPATIALDILSRMQSTSAFGSIYQYSNPIAAAAGLVGGHVAYPRLELGAAYDRAMASRVFKPLGMKRTTFDFDRAMRGNYAPSHGVSSEGELALVESARDRKMHAMRATGGAWSNVDDLMAYLKVELSGGLRRDGRRYIASSALKARWAPQVKTGKDAWYGMGLDTEVSSGTPMMFHGGRLYGQRSNIVWWPEHGVGLVILMNASTGNVLMDAFPRKMLEVLFDGEPEADSMVAAAAAGEREQRKTWRRSVHIPALARHIAVLAPQYRNEWLGEIAVKKSGAQAIFDFGAWRAPVASREHPDGTVEFIVLTPSPPFPFVAGVSGAQRTLTIRDAQNEYVFVESK